MTFRPSLATLIAISLLSGCTSYGITEREMTDYLSDKVEFNRSVGVHDVLHAQVSIDDLEVKIGRISDDRISVVTNTTAAIEMLSIPTKSLDLDIEFSAIPEYDKQSGEIYLKSIRLERFEESGKILPSNLETLLRPAVSMIGFALAQKPAYKLDSSEMKQALIKSAEPNLVIKNNRLVIELVE